MSNTSKLFDSADDVAATVRELVRMGLLVAVFDPECGEDRYCTPEFKRAHDSNPEGSEPQDETLDLGVGGHP